MLFLPKGTENQLERREWVLSEKQAANLYRSLQQSMKDEKGFEVKLRLPGDDRLLTLILARVGATAAFFILVDEAGPFVYSVTALLSKIDLEEDRKAIEFCRGYPQLNCIEPVLFDEPIKADHPVSATFFADIRAANYAPLYPYINNISAAFFAQFGFGEDMRDSIAPD